MLMVYLETRQNRTDEIRWTGWMGRGIRGLEKGRHELFKTHQVNNAACLWQIVLMKRARAVKRRLQPIKECSSPPPDRPITKGKYLCRETS